MQVAATNPFLRFYTFLAKMGLVMLDDPPRIIDMAGREWGEAVDGLALSIRELAREDSRSVAGISVVMKNENAAEKTLTVPDWIHFFEIAGLDLSPYGKKVRESARTPGKTNVTLAPGGAIETDLPIGRIYDMRTPGDYSIQLSCRLPDGNPLRSNAIAIRV